MRLSGSVAVWRQGLAGKAACSYRCVNEVFFIMRQFYREC